MKPTKRNTVSLLLALVALSWITAGCRTTPKPKPVAWTIVLEKKTPASIEVDLIGVNSITKSDWLNKVRPNTYWSPGNSTRRGAEKVSTKFESGLTWRLEATNSIWTTWLSRGSTELLIFADLHLRDPSDDANDPRRFILSLNKKDWGTKERVLHVVVEDERIYPLTPPKLAK